MTQSWSRLYRPLYPLFLMAHIGIAEDNIPRLSGQPGTVRPVVNKTLTGTLQLS